MFPQNPALTQMFQLQLESSLRLGRIALDSAEQLSRLQLASSKEAAEQLAQAASQLGNLKDPSALMALRGDLSARSMECSLNYARGLYELGSQAQAELGKLLEERMSALQGSLSGSLNAAGSQAPLGADAFLNAIKTSMGASNAAIDSLSRAARQVADFADASVKAASTATAEAVRGVAKSK